MKNLNISDTVEASSSGNISFSAEKVRAQLFGGLMDPVIGFDHFKLTKDVFGAHPHAGMSALSYLFEDSVPYHNLDSIGTDVMITPGSLMWTWAGRGVVHTEFPVPEGSEVHGLQLFINMPAKQKQTAPKGTFINSPDIPEIISAGFRVRVVTGRSGAVINQAVIPQDITFLHIFLTGEESFSHELPSGWNGTVYVVNGKTEIAVGEEKRFLEQSSVICFSSLENQKVTFSPNGGCQLIFISGAPLKEDIFAHGSLTMGSSDELAKAMSDFNEGRMGFIRMEDGNRKVVLPVLE
jgi:redox-sensitive bicupin YhaK (pirin superfamily)